MNPFHATEFEQSRPTKVQIAGINKFLCKPFWRFAVMSDERTDLSPGVDAHQAVSPITIRFFKRLVATYENVENIALVFEAFGRGDELVKREFNRASMKLVNGSGKQIEVDGYLMEKKFMEPGLEVADLIAHTAGRQRRHQIAGKEGDVLAQPDPSGLHVN